MSDWSALLLKSLDKTRDMPESRYFQLATVDSSGLPHNRTVVCRGVDENQSLMWVVTDTRNKKVAELKGNPHAAVCWYFAKTREQYRMTVSCRVDTPNEDRTLCQQQWDRLSVAARQQFLWGEPGSERTAPKKSLIDHSANTDVLPDHFCVLTLLVESVDYLNLRGNPQQRQCFEKRQGQWHSKELIP
ncbi:MAG: pyridoxamine 5'-phosphate oxidase [Gammaproteobacteria bacterium]|nr:pyridoxamine 5'-phosphate oxidase [Gammaproteobacteria bacterium]